MREYGRPLGSAPPASLNDRRQSGGINNINNNNNNNNQEINYDRLNYVPRQRSRPQQGQQSSAQQGTHDGGEHDQGGVGQWFGGQTGPDGRWKHQDELDQLTEQFGKFADSEYEWSWSNYEIICLVQSDKSTD